MIKQRNLMWLHKFSCIVLFLLMALSLAGCSPDWNDVVKQFIKDCDGTVSAEIHASSWGRTVIVKCDDMPLKDNL